MCDHCTPARAWLMRAGARYDVGLVGALREWPPEGAERVVESLGDRELAPRFGRLGNWLGASALRSRGRPGVSLAAWSHGGGGGASRGRALRRSQRRLGRSAT